MSAPLLVFLLAGQRYAVAVSDVREIVRLPAITPLPGAPAVISGLLDIHGETAPVVDLRAAFGLPSRPAGAEDHLIVVQTARRTLAVHVDQVVGVDSAGVETVPARLDEGSLEGWARLADGLVLVHDVERFVSRAEEQALEALLRAREAR